MGEFGQLTEQKKQLELELTQEEFRYRHVEERKNMAKVGIIANVVLIIVVTFLLGYVAINNAFGAVILPLFLLLWIAFMVVVIRHGAPDARKLATNSFEKEKIESFERCRKLRLMIEELESQLEQINVTRWNS